MKFTPLPAVFHAANRDRLVSSMEKGSIAIIDTLDLLTRGDFEYPFHPDPNFYYLTGISEPEAVLVLVPDHPDKKFRQILFISGTTEFVGRWEGERLTPVRAAKLSGVDSVLQIHELDQILDRLTAKYQTVYLNTEESVLSPMTSPSLRRAADLRLKLPLHSFRSATKLIAELRIIKAEPEIDQIKQAIEITAGGLRAAMLGLRPGMSEYEVEAILGFEYTSRGAQGHGFMPVVASGSNATTIHYMKNDAVIGESDLVQFDTGAEVGWYSADISRCFPSSGRFTPRQRQVYEAVLRTQQAVIPLHKPGASVLSINERIQSLLLEELVNLKLISAADAGSKRALAHLSEYYPHISHHLGLDVHDTGGARVGFKPGMVVSCEPGLYIKKEGIGARIEDDILITNGEPVVLSAGVPSGVDEIEDLMKAKK